MSKYAEMTDFEINKLVYLKVKPEREAYKDCRVGNYCEYPSDAWPIILEAEIDVNYLKSEPGIVLASKGDYYARSRNRLRAQMEVYLMMGDEA